MALSSTKQVPDFANRYASRERIEISYSWLALDIRVKIVPLRILRAAYFVGRVGLGLGKSDASATAPSVLARWAGIGYLAITRHRPWW
jgi:hypothetical protein